VSDQPTAKPAAKPDGGGGGKKDNVFTHKIGPLPMIAWVALVAVILVIWRMYEAKKNGTSTGGSAASGTASTGANTVPQFVNQTYTTLNAPPAPIIDEDHRHHPPSRRHAASDRDARHHPKHPDQDQDHGKDDDDDDKSRDKDRDQGDGHGGKGDDGTQWHGGDQSQGHGGDGQGQWQGGQSRGQDNGTDQGWKGAFSHGHQDQPTHESQRSGRGRGKR
jgi:hypothetical protein